MQKHLVTLGWNNHRGKQYEKNHLIFTGAAQICFSDIQSRLYEESFHFKPEME